jgi:imidazolonepropionase-like amidohydrolase
VAIVLANCAVVDGLWEQPLSDAGVWIGDGRIAAVGPVDDVVADAREAGPVEILDLDGAHVLPGLMNMHVHLGLALPGQDEFLAEGAAQRALRMASNAKAALDAGITTVRLLGESEGTDFALRRAIDRGQVPGPRIFTAGSWVVCTGGHAHQFGVEADGADGFRRAVRAQLKTGVDLVKICVSGGIAGEHEGFGGQLTHDEMSAVADAAHAWGRMVTAHAGPADVISEAIDCGIDGVEHGYLVTDEVAQKMAERGTWLVPTICVSRDREFFDRIGAPEWMIQRALAAGEEHWAALKSCIAAGVKIAMGTDMLPAEPLAETNATVREMELMQDAGMSARDVVGAATWTAAEMMGVGERLGSVQPGRFADLIAVDGDPSVEVSNLRNIRFVMKAGLVVRSSLASKPVPVS